MAPSAIAKVQDGLRNWCAAHLNFYRVHLIYFTITPLIASAIFYASNGEHHYSYIDSLFICTSAICVCGLSPILLSQATTWQQVILLLLICGGSITSVSLVTILIRLRFFKDKFKQLVETSPAARKRLADIEAFQEVKDDQRTLFQFLHPNNLIFRSLTRKSTRDGPHDSTQSSHQPDTPPPSGTGTPQRRNGKKGKRLNPAMIRKVDNYKEIQEAINRLAEERRAEEEAKEQQQGDAEKEGDGSTPSQGHSSATVADKEHSSFIDGDNNTNNNNAGVVFESPQRSPQLLGESAVDDSEDEDSPANPSAQPFGTFPRSATRDTGDPSSRHFTTAHTIDFREDTIPTSMRRRRRSTVAGDPFPRTRTGYSTKHTGYGGFPNPVRALAQAVGSRVQDNVTDMVRTHTQQTMAPTRTMTNTGFNMHRTGTIQSVNGEGARPAPYITFDAIVGRNSRFRALNKAQQDELGGVEFRALSLLWKIVALYWLGFQLVSFAMMAPYLSSSIFEDRFSDDPFSPSWYSFFNIWSAFSNTGLSLDDGSMTKFNATYFYVLVLCLLILAGNTAFPIFLRLIIWTLSKIVPTDSRMKETLQFLLDHPRRSFLYLFPSYQTWFLVFVLVVLNCTDWFFFLILDIGNSVLEAIPLRIRVLDGFFQALAVRAAGFNIIDVSQTAPSLQVLYVIMMYIAVYPIALSIRSTNVYEERSMGLYEEDDESEVEQEYYKNRMTGSYIAYHARKQLAFDIWWLVFALWLICIVERTHIEDFESDSWFNVFTVLFELTSAYGTVGLSLGSPETGTSLCGSFGTLSKLILVAVIIRGRHRGLPNAIDRAVLLPSDMTLVENGTIAADAPLGRFGTINRGGPEVARTMSMRSRGMSQHARRPSGQSFVGSANRTMSRPEEQQHHRRQPSASGSIPSQQSPERATNDGPHVGFETPKRPLSPATPIQDGSEASSTAVNEVRPEQ